MGQGPPGPKGEQGDRGDKGIPGMGDGKRGPPGKQGDPGIGLVACNLDNAPKYCNLVVCDLPRHLSDSLSQNSSNKNS